MFFGWRLSREAGAGVSAVRLKHSLWHVLVYPIRRCCVSLCRFFFLRKGLGWPCLQDYQSYLPVHMDGSCNGLQLLPQRVDSPKLEGWSWWQEVPWIQGGPGMVSTNPTNLWLQTVKPLVVYIFLGGCWCPWFGGIMQPWVEMWKEPRCVHQIWQDHEVIRWFLGPKIIDFEGTRARGHHL